MSLAEQFRKLTTNRHWVDSFQKLEIETRKLADKRKLTYDIALSDENQRKNRYTNVLPYDQNRVSLKDFSETDYINGSPIVVEKARRRYILTQGPVCESVSDFWQMVMENEVPAIVMLNKLFEGHSLKCEKYFPSSEDSDDPMSFHPFKVKLDNEKTYDNFVVRNLTVTDELSGKLHSVVQVQYTEWPDFGVPASTAHFLEMLNCLKELDVLTKSEDDPPVVVHCSAGIGRSGTFVLVDSVLRMIELGLPEGEVDINAILLELRCQRMGLIQTHDQLKFAWTAIIDALHEKSRAASESSETNTSGIANMNGSSDGLRKRKSESNDTAAGGSGDSEKNKRREQVAQMVEKSRRAEEERRRRDQSSIFGVSLSGRNGLIAGGAVTLAAILIYYIYNRQ